MFLTVPEFQIRYSLVCVSSEPGKQVAATVGTGSKELEMVGALLAILIAPALFGALFLVTPALERRSEQDSTRSG
jgi:hypothetical protein